MTERGASTPAPGSAPAGPAAAVPAGRRQVVVTGLGVVSPAGWGTGVFWSALLAGRAATGEVTLFDTADCLTHRGGQVPGAPTGREVEQRRWARALSRQPSGGASSGGAHARSRSERFALAATAMALDDGGLLDRAGRPRVSAACAPERAGAAFGTVIGNRPGIEPFLRALRGARGAGSAECRPEPAPEAGCVTAHEPARVGALPAVEFGLRGPNLVPATACAAGNTAIAQAADAIAEGRADLMVAGGADELSEAMFLMFNSFRALAPQCVQPFDAHRRGLLLGEGAAVLLLETADGARARGAPAYAAVAGHGSYCDAYHMTAPHPEGLGAIRSMRAALRAAELSPDAVDVISAHGTGTPANDAIEARAIAEVFGPAVDRVPITAPKSVLGHTQGAAGAVGAVCCVLAVRHGNVPPIANLRTPESGVPLDLVTGEARRVPVTAALNNAFGFGGNNCCTVFTALPRLPRRPGTTAPRRSADGARTAVTVPGNAVVRITGIGAVTAAGTGSAELWEAVCSGSVNSTVNSTVDGTVYSTADGSVDGSTDGAPPGAVPPRTLPAPPGLPAAAEVRALRLGPVATAEYLGTRGVRALSPESRAFAVAAVAACRDAGLPRAFAREPDGEPSAGVAAGTGSAGLGEYADLFARRLEYGVRGVNPAQGPQTGLNAPAATVSIFTGAGGPNLTLAGGRAASTDALAAALRTVRSGEAGVMLAGGVHLLTHTELQARRTTDPAFGTSGEARPFDRARDGAVPGEAAVVLVLEDAAGAARRGAPVLADVLGAGSALESGERGVAAAAGRAVSAALAESALRAEDVDAVFSSASGDGALDAAEAQAVHDLFGDRIPVCAVPGALGDCAGAGGALQAAVAALALRSGRMPGTPGFGTADPAVPALCIPRAAAAAPLRRVLVLSLDPRGSAAALLLGGGSP